MNIAETGQLLLLAAGYDNRKVDQINTTAWAAVLREVEFADAQRAVVEHQTGAHRHEYLTVAHVFDAVQAMNRATKEQVATDVRSAKARGIIAADHPDDQPLDARASDRLRTARESDRQTSLALSGADDHAGLGTVDHGLVLRPVG